MVTEAHSSISLPHPIKSEISSQPIAQLATCFHTDNLLSLSDPENGGDMFLRNIGCPSMDYATLYPRR
jgi:hypothetical protein